MNKNAALGLAGQYWSTIHASRSESRPFVAKNLPSQAETISSALREAGWRITGDGTGMPSIERTPEGLARASRVRQMSKQGKAAEVVEREIVDTMDAVDRRERPVRRVQISAEQFAADMARRTSR